MRTPLALLLAGLATGCLHTETVVRSTETVTASKTSSVSLSPRYEVSTSTSGFDLFVTANKVQMCRDDVTESVTVTDTVERTMPKAHWAILGGGAVALVGGVAAAIVGSSMQASVPAGLPTPEQAGAQDTGAILVPVGIGAAAVGGALVAWDLANLFTSGTRDTSRPTERTVPKEERACGTSPAANTVVTLTDASGAKLGAQTDATGRATFARAAVTDTFLSRWADRRGKMPAVQVTVGGDDAGTLDSRSAEALQAMLDVETSRRQRDSAAASEESSKLSAQETKSGKCSPERNAQLQGVLAQMKPIMEGSDLYYSAHAIGAAGSPPWSGRTGLSGDYHVFVIGYAGLGLDVRGRDGQPAALPSMYERVAQVASGGVVASKVLQANALEPFTVRVTGQGCALMAIFRAR